MWLAAGDDPHPFPMKTSPPIRWRCGDRQVDFSGRARVMGILNVTPDSFSDGGRYTAVEAAVEYALQMLQDGADILDVGGESTRPGAMPVPVEEELRRVVPVIEAVRRERDVLISVDTRKAAVAREALRCGARIINDVTALTGDSEMAEVARRHGAGVVLMHMLGEPQTMQASPRYDDVVDEVGAYLGRRIQDLVAAGLDPETLAIDPGIGFGKTVEHNVSLLVHLDRLCVLGRPVVVGLSRKSFLGKITGRELGDRLSASLGGAAYAILRGAQVIRVHDVKESCDVARLMAIFGAEQAGDAVS